MGLRDDRVRSPWPEAPCISRGHFRWTRSLCKSGDRSAGARRRELLRIETHRPPTERAGHRADPQGQFFMSLFTVLEALVHGMPEDASVTLTAAWLRRVLEAEKSVTASRNELLTLPEIAASVGRSVSTVRSWCGSGRIEGAFRLNGREWRVPAESLEQFLEAQQHPGCRTAPSKELGADLGAWRQLRARGGSL